MSDPIGLFNAEFASLSANYNSSLQIKNENEKKERIRQIATAIADILGAVEQRINAEQDPSIKNKLVSIRKKFGDLKDAVDLNEKFVQGRLSPSILDDYQYVQSPLVILDGLYSDFDDLIVLLDDPVYQYSQPDFLQREVKKTIKETKKLIKGGTQVLGSTVYLLNIGDLLV